MAKRDEELRKKIAAVIMSDRLPPDASDRDVEKLVPSSGYIVRKVREELTDKKLISGAKAAGGHRYKANAKPRGGYMHDGHGGTKRVRHAGKRHPTTKLVKSDRTVRISTDGTIEMSRADYLDWLRVQVASVEEWLRSSPPGPGEWAA